MKNKQIKIRKGTRRCFVGDIEIKEPVNHGYAPAIFYTLVEQAVYTVKEWNGDKWIDLNMKTINIRNNRKKSR